MDLDDVFDGDDDTVDYIPAPRPRQQPQNPQPPRHAEQQERRPSRLTTRPAPPPKPPPTRAGNVIPSPRPVGAGFQPSSRAVLHEWHTATKELNQWQVGCRLADRVNKLRASTQTIPSPAGESQSQLDQILWLDLMCTPLFRHISVGTLC